MRKILGLAVMALLLSSCSSEASSDSTNSAEKMVGMVPASCEIDQVIQEFDAQVPGSEFLPIEWQPLPETDLNAAISNDGIACSYGIQVAEVGGTILWASNSMNIWDERREVWIEEGLTSIDLPGIDETEAYILQDGASADEMHLWQVNVLINGIWIQVGASFLQNMDEALPIIKAAIEATA